MNQYHTKVACFPHPKIYFSNLFCEANIAQYLTRCHENYLINIDIKTQQKKAD